RGHRLAAARLADHAHRLAPADEDVDAVDRADHAVVGGELGPEPADVEERAAAGGSVGHDRHMTLRGSSTSRRPSPMKLIASTTRKIAAPADKAQCGAKSR